VRNYFGVLQLDRKASTAHVHQAIEQMPAAELHDQDDLQELMSNTKWAEHYRRVHLQYDAIAAVLATGNMETNTHHWDKRVVEFEPEQNTIELDR